MLESMPIYGLSEAYITSMENDLAQKKEAFSLRGSEQCIALRRRPQRLSLRGDGLDVELEDGGFLAKLA